VDQRVLVLGSKGYIGRYLYRFLEKETDVFVHSRRTEEISEVVKKIRPTIVINCSASSLNEKFNNSLEANFLYQSDFLRCLTESDAPITWIQLASYYELQIPFGRADYYSHHKSLFRNLLTTMHESEKVRVKTLFLPHVFGLDEKPSRIIPTIRNMILNKIPSNFSKGDQFLPLLHIGDASEAIWKSVFSEEKVTSATPFWHGRVRELVELAVGLDNTSLAKFDPENLQVDNFYPRVEFPSKVTNWEPKYSLDNLIEYLTN
jgi:nucleoside-diphosphate-sugar epimerase